MSIGRPAWPLGIILFVLAAFSTPAGEGPGKVGGCVCWLSAKDLARGPLASWPDKSGSGNDFKQVDPAAQPMVVENQNTKVKAVKFSGAQMLSNGKGRFTEKAGLGATPGEQYHLFLLVMVYPPGGRLLLCGESEWQKWTFCLLCTGSGSRNDGPLVLKVSLNGRVTEVKELVPGQPLLTEMSWDGKSLTGTFNGKAVKLNLGHRPLERQPIMVLGAQSNIPSGDSLNCLILEVIAFDHALSPEDAAKAREYFKTTYQTMAIPGI